MSVECYADYMRTHRWFGAPGSDHHGHGKIHSSIAHLYGRPRTWVEAFHSTGWGGTLEETFDWLIPWLRAGGNLYNPHAVYYSTRGGWWEWAPPSTCWRQPYWKHYRLFARAMTRLCASLAAGVHECDIGVLFPTSTIQAGALRTGLTTWAQEAQEAYRKLTGSMLWYDLRLGLLDQDRRDYDVLDEDSLQRAEIAEGTLRIGEEQYKAVILPNCVVLHAAAAERLLQFIEGGGTVIAVGDTPRWLAGPEGDGLLQRLRQAFRDGRAILVDAPEAVPGALAHLPRPVEAPVPTLRRRIGEATVVLVPATASQASRVRLEGWSYRYDFDVERYAARLRVTVRGVKGAPILWEPFSGEGRPLPYQEREDGVTVDVPFTDGPVALLEWAEEGSGAAAPAAPAAPARLLEELTGPWDVEYVPTIDNRWGDFAWPPGKPVPVQTWRARHLTVDADDEEVPAADDPRWRDVRLTFGPRAWRTEVLPAAELPEPLTTSTDPLTEGADLRWRPVVYSLTRGIDKDRLHYLALGPSGHVPEEFLDFGDVPSGHGVQVRTWLLTDEAIEAYLAVGAGARKEMWLNGRPVGGGGPGYLEIVPIRLVAGANLLEIRLVADEGGPLRGHFAVVRDPKRYVRPEWMQPDDPAVKDSVVRFSRIVEVPFPVTGATVQVGADVPCRLLVNGEVAGQQGGFDPYGRNARIIPYDISAFLKVGENEIAIEASDLGGPLSVLVDGLIEGEDTNILLSSDATWQVTRNGHPVGIRLRRQQWGDPAWQLLYRRPHPLPGASWLEETADEDVVYPLAPSLLAAPRVEWFAIELPPGATEAVFDCHGDVAAYVAGAPVPVGRGAGLEHRIELPEASRAERTLLVRVSGARGYTGGAVFESPVRFRVGTGRMELGDWTRQGLSAYSGGIAYRRVVTLSPGALESGRVVLDLGKVRGTAEVRVNGEMAGVRLLTPYRFDLTPWVKAGENVLEVVVYNTLAPYLDAVSPTYYVFEGQTVSGLFGPVRLLLE